MIISELLRDAAQQLESISDSPRLDAEVLLCHLLGKPRSYLHTWPDRTLDDEYLERYRQILEQRAQGTPVAHITGKKEFWSLDFQVSSDTLIPRPETELLVEYILDNYPASQHIKLADLGTGSGAIALAIASERPQWQITATEKSAAALEIARRNATALGIQNVNFVPGSWLEPLENRQFDIIVSNPPYIPASDPHLSSGDVRFEPRSALAAGKDGLDDIRIIAEQAAENLIPGGLLIIEHGYDQKASVHEIFTQSGYKMIRQIHDIANNPRLTLGINP